MASTRRRFCARTTPRAVAAWLILLAVLHGSVIHRSTVSAQTTNAASPPPPGAAPPPPSTTPPTAAPSTNPPPANGAGTPLNGLSSAEVTRFQNGKAAFVEIEAVPDGLGPVFNRDSCAACHGGPAPGGGNNTIFATRIGTKTNGKFDPLIKRGGPVLQARGITGLNGQRIPGEVVPPQATIVARRRTTHTFGLGLVEAVPDSYFLTLATMQATTTPETAGRMNMVMDLRTGKKVMGKFGWKAAVPNLINFSGDAYKEEMGITTPGWIRDANGRLIDEENPPQGDASLLKFNPVSSPNDHTLDDVIALADFMRLLAPPTRGSMNATVTAGEKVFSTIGCKNCHVSSLVTGSSPVAALSGKSFAPYSDFLLHDMGSLGDGIEQGQARGTDMRTAPLWGLRAVTAFLHDGRAKTLDDAILQHRGQGQAAATRFQGLSSADKSALIAFLKSL